MALLAPLFLLGLLAVGLPLWLHRLQTQSSERQPFSSAMLLERTQQPVHRQRKLRYLLLLAARIAVIALLALTFAQPVIKRFTAVSQGGGLQMVVLDTSLSMGAGQRFAAARRAAEALAADADGDGALELVTAAGSVRPVTAAGVDRSAFDAALASLTPGSERLDLGEMMDELQGLAAAVGGPVTVHIISDFQATGVPARFADLIPESGNPDIGWVLHAVTRDLDANDALRRLQRDGDKLRVTVQHYGGGTPRGSVALSVDGEPAGTQALPDDAGAVTEVEFALPDLRPGNHRVEARLNANDDLAADNRAYLTLDNRPRAAVPLLTTASDSPAVLYLSSALAASDSRYTVKPTLIAGLDPRTLQRYPWLIVEDLGDVGPQLAAALTDYLRGGGRIFAAAGSHAATATRLPVVGLAVGGGALTGGGDDSGLRVGAVDTTHPVLTAGAGWRDVSVYDFLPVTPSDDTQVLVSLEDGEPLLMERRIGSGAIMLLASGLDNGWNDLPVRPVFVSFTSELARYLAAEQRLPTALTVGDTLNLGNTDSAAQVIDPDGRNLLSLQDTLSAPDIRLQQAGIYEVYTRDLDTLVAVNADPRESDLAPMAAETLQRWRSLSAGSGQGQAATAAEETTEGEPLRLWYGLLIALAAFMLAESLLGNRHLRLEADQT